MPALFSAITSEILGVPEKLVENLGTIWGAMACGFAIDLEPFEKICQETKSIYFESVGWYSMPPTLHKILEHGRQIIAECPVPFGLTNEEASEANNKVLRGLRLHHSRRTSWRNGIQDLFHRLMDISDPQIQEMARRNSSRSSGHQALTPQILALLKAPEPEGGPATISEEAGLQDDADINANLGEGPNVME